MKEILRDGYIEAIDPIVMAVGSEVSFKAIPKPAGCRWPLGKPVWSGASGSGDEASWKKTVQ